MSLSATEIPEFIDRRKVETAVSWIMRDARDLHGQDRVQRACEAGLRLAQARDPRLMVALERMAEILEQVNEDQLGRSQRMAEFSYQQGVGTLAERAAPMSVQTIRIAYEHADRGTPFRPAAMVYAAAARLAHLID